MMDQVIAYNNTFHMTNTNKYEEDYQSLAQPRRL